MRNRCWDQGCVGKRGEFNDPDTISIVIHHLSSYLERKAGLAGASWPGERDQPNVRALKQLHNGGDLALAPNQRIALEKEIVELDIERLECRKVRRQTIDEQLEDTLRVVKVFQSM